MENLFRFMLVRPAIAQSEESLSIQLAQPTPFQITLERAQRSANPKNALKVAAARFIKDSTFIGDVTDLPVFSELKMLHHEFDELEKKLIVANADIVKAVEKAFGISPKELRKKKVLDGPMAALKDSLIAIKLLPEEHSRPIHQLTNQLRDLEVVLKAVVEKDFPGKGNTLRRYRRRSLALPLKADLHSIVSPINRKKEEEKRQAELNEKKRKKIEYHLDGYKRVKAALHELTDLSSEHLHTTFQQASAGFLVPVMRQPIQIFSQELQGIGNIDTNTASPEMQLQNGVPEFLPLQLGEMSFRLKPSTVGFLSESTQQVLNERKMNVSERPLDQIVELLHTELTELSRQLDSLIGRPMKLSFKRIGNALVKIKTPVLSRWDGMAFENVPMPIPSNPVDISIPKTHGSVKPSGVADLFVVKQQLVRYEAADVAHIENILKGEHKERDHSRRRETEDLTFRETEVTTSEERELESTDRFEMSRETNQTIQVDASLKSGLTLSGKYRPTVDFAASAEISSSGSFEEATKTAAQFSRDVTERSANKVTERVLERASLRVTNEVIEKNRHILNNVDGAGNIAGVYQWVNKVYQAQMFNYGLRTLYDFMVPEPGIFLIAALQQAHAHTIEIEKPMPFDLQPNQITETNYHSLILQYGATDVMPTPEMFITKSLNFHSGGANENTGYIHSAFIEIKEGYKAVYGSVGRVVNILENNFAIDVILGSRVHRLENNNWIWLTPCDGEQDTIAFALNTYNVSSISIAVEVKCQRTARALLKWQHETHAKLPLAYKARLAEYEEKLARLEVQAGIEIPGKNPALNRELMLDEIKKNCISILTEQNFDLFNAISTGSNGLPEISLQENETIGPYVRFFEQAFEWEQMTWITYPYFWGRKSQWDERISYEDADPLFNQFLKTGYCRVVVPARLGFEGAIDHYMTFGDVWNGGPLPAISDPQYLPIADEISEQLDKPGDEIPQGDPWIIRIPTTLVHLRPDDKLPSWKQDANGNWIGE